MINGKNLFLDKTVKKLLPILEILQKEFDGWIVANKYPQGKVCQELLWQNK